MGLDANFPAVTMNDPQGHVTVYNQDHLPIGQLGPTPFESPSVNVTCRLKAWEDAYWYRLLNPDGWDFPDHCLRVGRRDARTESGQPYPIPECKNIGCRRKAGQAAAVGVLAAGAVTAIRSWRRRPD